MPVDRPQRLERLVDHPQALGRRAEPVVHAAAPGRVDEQRSPPALGRDQRQRHRQ
ncbi:hypothetical protein JNW87_35325, partial [Micromonospora sp. ATA51]|nr:hypothetical protein [Micromonospora sp. ATA51]